MQDLDAATRRPQSDPEPPSPLPPVTEPPPGEQPQHEPPPSDPPRGDPPGGPPPDQLSAPEPWMRGPIPGVHPLLAPFLYSFQQAREDLAHWTDGLTHEEMWERPHGFGSVGFHLRHIAGST